MGTTSFVASDKILKNILFGSDCRKYRVPRNQRPFAWTPEEQVFDFWEDLHSNETPFFFGSLIFNTESESEDGYVDIIDGQQRLLTVTILLAVIRDHAKQLDSQRAEFYHSKDIIIKEFDEDSHSNIIRPSDTLREFFEANIQNFNACISITTPKSKEHDLVKRNYSFLFERVKHELNRFDNREQKLNVLKRLRDKISKLSVICIEITQEEDAYDIFEATNARGLELSIADLLKNLIFQKIPPAADRDFAKDVWQEISSDVEAANTELKKFIRYFWISKYEFISEKKLYRAIKKRTANWENLLDDLWKNSALFNTLVSGSEQDFQQLKLKNFSKIYKSVFALRLMGVSQCYVLLLSILRNIGKLKSDPTRLIQLIENFTFQYSVVCKLPTNKIEKLYSNYAIQIERAVCDTTDKKLPSEIQRIFAFFEDELKSDAPASEEFTRKFQDLCYRNSETTRQLVKYILSRINSHYSKTSELEINFSDVNIEHILPQKPHKDWGLKKKEIKPYANKLGNLTLLAVKLNSRAQNSTITIKLPELEKSELPITKELVASLKKKKHTWGENQINKRQEEFAEIAYDKIWKI